MNKVFDFPKSVCLSVNWLSIPLVCEFKNLFEKNNLMAYALNFLNLFLMNIYLHNPSRAPLISSLMNLKIIKIIMMQHYSKMITILSIFILQFIKFLHEFITILVQIGYNWFNPNINFSFVNVKNILYFFSYFIIFKQNIIKI